MSAITCPSCGKEMDASTEITDRDSPVGEAQPPAGSVAICFYCTTINIYTGEGLALRAATADELEHFVREPEVLRIQQHIRAYKEATGL